MASYFPDFHAAALAMISAQGGIVGWVADSDRFLGALARPGARSSGGARSYAGAAIPRPDSKAQGRPGSSIQTCSTPASSLRR